jgi:hypothetical protein
MTKRLAPTGVGKSASRGGGPSKARAMTENTHFNVDNGTYQAAMTADVFGWCGDGLHWTWQRCGRYTYQKVLVHSTNSDHLVPSAPSPTSKASLRIAAHYAPGRLRNTRAIPPEDDGQPVTNRRDGQEMNAPTNGM